VYTFRHQHAGHLPCALIVYALSHVCVLGTCIYLYCTIIFDCALSRKQKHLYESHILTMPTAALQQQQQQQQQHSTTATTTAAAAAGSSGSRSKRGANDDITSSDSSTKASATTKATKQQHGIEVDTISGLRLNDTSWSALTSSFEDTFCRKCLKYVCVTHGRLGQHIPRDPTKNVTVPTKNVTVPTDTVSKRDQLHQLLLTKRYATHSVYTTIILTVLPKLCVVAHVLCHDFKLEL
jgi:hypothetical protein